MTTYLKKHFKIYSYFLLFLFSILHITSYAKATSEDEKFKALADKYMLTLFELDPELAEDLAPDIACHDKLTDYSLKAVYASQHEEDLFLENLKNINQKLLNSDNSLAYNILLEALTANEAARICKQELWELKSFSPWFSNLADLAQKQTVGDKTTRDNALNRWKNFPKVVDDNIDTLRMGLKEGYSVPKVILPRIIAQLDALLASEIKSSPFFVPGTRDLDEDFQQKFYTLVVNKINPGLKKYRDFLSNEYMPYARETLGVSSLKNGMQCYQAMLRKNTTLNLSPKEIQDIGYKAIAYIESRMSEISKESFGGMSNQDLMQYAIVHTLPFKTEQDMLDYNYAALARAKAALPNLMTLTPKADVEIKPYPEYLAKAGVVGSYQSPSEDGSRPGIFYINTWNYETLGYADLESTAFHESIPGHHLQLALMTENNKLHPLVRMFRNSAITEGWGLYAEQLADEAHLYSSPLSRVGYLSKTLWRAARLVVDTGLHAFGWSKEQASSYLRAHSTLLDFKISSEVDRYITMPAQATSYYIGFTAILNARGCLKEKQKTVFSLSDFHDTVLTLGPVPLSYIQNLCSI